MQTSVESLTRTEAVDLEVFSLDRVVHPDSPIRRESKPPEPGVPRQFLHPVTWPRSKRLVQETPDGVEELLPYIGLEFCELLLCPLMWNVLKRHGSLPLSKKLLVYAIEFTGRKPAALLPAFLELCQPFRRVIVVKQL